MKMRRASVLLSLLLLAGCAPAAETPPSPPARTPAATVSPAASATPAPAPEPVDFHAFLRRVNDARRAVIESGEPLDISAYTPDFYEQNDAFTEAEMAVLTTPHDPEGDLTREELIADAETCFKLLKTTYGAYEYFGGDEVFEPILEQVRADLEGADELSTKTLADSLAGRLAPILVDGHFRIGDSAMREEHTQYMYYVPGVYFDDLTGLDTDYVKPTIGPDGRITYCYAVMSDGGDLPPCPVEDAAWLRAKAADGGSRQAFQETEQDGVPVLVSRTMYANDYYPGQRAELERFASCGGEYASAPLLIFDLRGNGGGSDKWVMDWFEGWAGEPARPRRSGGHKFSQLACRAMPDYYPADRMGTWRNYTTDGAWVENENPVFVLTDKGVASSGETAVQFMRTADSALFVGGPTLGCALVPNNLHFYLPNTGVELYFGTGLSFCETQENLDGVGYLPDLWVNPPDALDAVSRMIEYYGLK